MQLRALSALVIFLGSYLPLSLILLAQDIDYDKAEVGGCWKVWDAASVCNPALQHPALSIPIFFLCLACFAVTLGVLKLTRVKHQITITEHKHVPSDLMNYTLPYVVSFMSIGYQETGKFIGVIIFLLWMFWITYKAGQTMMNPVLIAFGWKLYDVIYTLKGDTNTPKKPHTAYLLSQSGLQTGTEYQHMKIQDIVIIK